MYILLSCNTLLSNIIGGFWYGNCRLKYRANSIMLFTLSFLLSLKNQVTKLFLGTMHSVGKENFHFVSWLPTFFRWRRVPIKMACPLQWPDLLKMPEEVDCCRMHNRLTNPVSAEQEPNSPGKLSNICWIRL